MSRRATASKPTPAQQPSILQSLAEQLMASGPPTSNKAMEIPSTRATAVPLGFVTNLKPAANPVVTAVADSLERTAKHLDGLVVTHHGVSDAGELRERAGALLNFAINRIFALGRSAPELVAPKLGGNPPVTISDPVDYWTSWVAPWIVSIGGHRRPDISPEWLTPKSKPGDMTSASKRKWEALEKASKEKDPVAAKRRVEENDPTPLERESVHVPTELFPVPLSQMDESQKDRLLRKSCECWAEHCRVVVEICRRAALAALEAATTQLPASPAAADPLTIDNSQAAVLRVLRGKHPVRMTTEDLTSVMHITEKTIRVCLTKLSELGMVTNPIAKRGRGLTQKGLNFVETLPKSAGEKLVKSGH